MLSTMLVKLAKDASLRARRRVKRHGYEYDLVLEHFIDGKPAPFGMLLKSHKTGVYKWFDSKQITIPAMPYTQWDCNAVPEIIEGVKTYAPNKELLHEYLDHVMSNVFSKRDQKKYHVLYERVKADQPSLIEILSA